MKEYDFNEMIQLLDLKPHPEGGYYKEIYRSQDQIHGECLPERYKKDRISSRSFYTSIYYLLVKEDISRFHKIQSDEIWHFYLGSPLRLHILDEKNRSYFFYDLGFHSFQYVVPHNKWFAAEVIDKQSFSLVGCTVSLGFDFEDFLLADRYKLLKTFPDYKEIIEKFTKE